MKTLLLNSNYEIISFISFKRTIKLFINNKVDILSEWEEIVKWETGQIYWPATIRLRYAVPWRHRRMKCSRKSTLKRDCYQCQYCGIILPPSKLTWDHIIPRSKGGTSSWNNVVTACNPCNRSKGDRTPEEANMSLLRPPISPQKRALNEYPTLNPKHKDWEFYLI